jgi:phosphatidylserine/phosphatidylglycerophosphate/cardiolipin synthase-like enzyme
MPIVLLLGLSGCLANTPNWARPGPLKPPAAVEDNIAVYFSPRGGAMAAIIQEINGAQRSVDVQAYLITAKSFVDALKGACARGVRVRVILDKNNAGGAYSAMTFFRDGTIPLWRDGQHKDAHDKVVLIDGHTLITGSFNFTDQSDEVNAENLLILRDKPVLYAAYQANFERHLRHSEHIESR